MMNTLEVLEAKEEIRDLVARYCHYVDFGCFDEWMDLFTDDALWQCPMFGRYSGKAELQNLVDNYKIYLSKEKTKGRHYVVNLHYDVDAKAGHATGACYWSMFHAAEGKTEVIRSGRYIDKIEKVNGKWLFKERIIDHDSLPSKG